MQSDTSTLTAAGVGLVLPTTAHERYEFLDVLRGFSLVGIVLANMISYSLYLYLPGAVKKAMATAASDRLLDLLELVLIESKFYTIFATLFGVGFSILITRARAKSLQFDRFFIRRMLVLFFIGLAHALLFWHNDILEAYAVCGVLLLPFVRASNRTILGASAIALVAPLAFKLLDLIPKGTLSGPRDLLLARFGFTMAERVSVWAEGGLTDILLLNAASWFGQVDYVVSSGMFLKIYGCFLLGFWIGRNELHKQLERHADALKRIAIGGIVVGIPLNVAYAMTFDSGTAAHALIETIAVVPLSAGYACAMAWWWARTRGQSALRIFAPVGRMALTNYVGQSLVCMLIFRGVGGELGGKVGPTLYLPIGLGVYLVQVVASRAWLARFQYGPLEWLWRVLTYGSRVPIRKVAVARAGVTNGGFSCSNVGRTKTGGSETMSRLLLVLMVCGALVSCASSQPPVSSNASSGVIEQASDRFWSARGDVAALGTYITDDAVLMFPGLPDAAGRAAFLELVGKRFVAARSADLKIHRRQVDVYGDTAYELAWYAETFVGGGESTRMQGRYFTVWKRGSDGAWRVQRMLVNFSGVGPDPTPAG